jgi:inhibitor of cysteine peptidase
MPKPPLTLGLALATGLLLAILAAGSSAWSAPAWSQAQTPMLLLTSTDHGRRLAIHPGSEIQLTLNENASTGYRWSLDRLDPTLIELVSEQSLANPSGGAHSQGLPPALGSPGQVVYRFKALRPGRTEITLNYQRSWEGDRSTIDQFRLSLHIHAKSAIQVGPDPTKHSRQ